MDNPTMDLSKPSLRWMCYEATAAGLRLDPFSVEWDVKDPNVIIHESLTLGWRPFEYIPWRRLTYRTPDDTTLRYVTDMFHKRSGCSLIYYRLHRGAARHVLPGQKIHSSVFRVEEAVNRDPNSCDTTFLEPCSIRLMRSPLPTLKCRVFQRKHWV